MLRVGSTLTKLEKGLRSSIRAYITSERGKFTDVDWLLNTGELEHANSILERVETELDREYQVEMAEHSGSLEELDETTEEGLVG